MIHLRYIVCVILACTTTAKRFHKNSIAHLHPERWVVVTTSAHPTPAIKEFAALPGWRVVVVADKETAPKWKHSGVEFLSVEKQKTLEYSVAEHLRWDNIGRKNLGYLWAIKHGATIIYDTIDTNFPFSENVTILPPGDYPVYQPQDTARTVNVYQSFGIPDMWPRGLPLADVHTPAPTRFHRKTVNPLIQQGLVDISPDVDAIYRQTRRLNRDLLLDMFPVVVPKPLMCPFNAQNTIFHKEAFWGLLLPVTTTRRVADIWRGYWVQRLLWEIGGSLCFTPPTAEQDEELHGLMLEFADEQKLYEDAGNLIDFLVDWKFTGEHFSEAIPALAQAMAEKGFWLQEDADLARSWVEDLNRLDYQWPELSPVELLPHVSEGMPAYPLMPLTFPRFENVYLIIMYSVPVPHHIPPILQEMYEPLFAKVIHTGILDVQPYINASSVHITWVPCKQHGSPIGGIHMQECQAKAMYHYPVDPSGGYLQINDDTLINPCGMVHLPRDKLWTAMPLEAFVNPDNGLPDRWPWREAYGLSKDVEQNLVSTLLTSPGPLEIIGVNASQLFGLKGTRFTKSWYLINVDIYYVPFKHRDAFIGLAMHFTRHRLQSEVAHANIIGILEDGRPNMTVIMGGGWLWYEDRENPDVWRLSQTGMDDEWLWVHSIKMSVHSPYVTEWWRNISCVG